MNIQFIISIIALFVSVALIAYLFIGYNEKRLAVKRLKKQGDSSTANFTAVDSLFRPIFSLYSHLLSPLKLPHQRAELDKKFSYAALDHFTPEDFWAFQILSSVMFLAFTYILFFELRFLDIKYSVPWWLSLGMLILGFYFPRLWINSIIQKRRNQIILEFPPFVDNLTLTVEAGLDFIAAVNRIAQKMRPSPLREEVSRMLSEIQLGRTRAQALKSMSLKVGSTEISTFVSVLVQADRLGTSIGKALRIQAERLRRERFESAERKGAIASQKLLFPLVFFIMPAVFIVVFGPILVKLLTGGLEGLML
ncbi:MAG: type II secretion system F family protein [Pseudomonadota bacterium]